MRLKIYILYFKDLSQDSVIKSLKSAFNYNLKVTLTDQIKPYKLYHLNVFVCNRPSVAGAINYKSFLVIQGMQSYLAFPGM